MQSGALNEVLTIQQQEQGRDSTNQRVTNWVNIPQRAVMWCSVMYRAASEGYEADQKAARRTLRVKIHFRQDLNEGMTVLFRNRRWDIVGIEPFKQRDAISLDLRWTENQYRS